MYYKYRLTYTFYPTPRLELAKGLRASPKPKPRRMSTHIFGRTATEAIKRWKQGLLNPQQYKNISANRVARVD